MITNSWIYDAIIYIYALSLLFYFSDAVSRSRSAKRTGTGLLLFVWVLQTVYFVARVIEVKDEPVLNLFTFLFFFSWLLVTMSLLIDRFARLDLLVFFLNAVGFSVLVLNLLTDPRTGLAIHEDQTHILFLHIAMAVCSYTAFTIAAVFSGMYVFLHRSLKSKRWSALMRRLPSLEKIDRFIFIWVSIGVPLLALSLSLGAAWIVVYRSPGFSLMDPKVLSSLVVLAAYVYYYILRLRARTTGNRLAVWALAAFIVLLLNVFVLNQFSSYHFVL